MKIQRALLSVSDKTGLVEFATGLAAHGVELLSTGGTARTLRDAGLAVQDVSVFTGFPEMLDGRVKTLHPKVHAGLLGIRGNPAHEATMREHGLHTIDLLCVNLYPFEATVARAGVTVEEAIEQIDIGGPAMLRSAAKNHASVTVVTDPADYARVLAEMAANGGDTTHAFRRMLAFKVYAQQARYDGAIARYLATMIGESAGPLVLSYPAGESLRYGENPHQRASFHRDPRAAEACVAHATILHGKEMSYNNYVDGDSALEAVRDLCPAHACAIIKHNNPCGYATGRTLAEAFEAAWQGDIVSAFGSVIAVSTTVDLAMARLTEGRFIEVLIAPGYDADALEFLRAKSKQLRILQLHQPLARAIDAVELKPINGGVLVQQKDTGTVACWNSPTSTPFPEAKRALAEFGIKASKFVRSNAIVLVHEHAPGSYALLGMGAGQPNRIDSLRKLAVPKAEENLARMAESAAYGRSPREFRDDAFRELVLVSDAFFPFADNIEAAASAGIRYIVQPGGSKKDEDVIAACDRFGIAMAFTGMRHFKH